MEREEDVNGNAVVYKYARNSSTHYNLYLSEIQYNFVEGNPKARIRFDLLGYDGGNNGVTYRTSYRVGGQLISGNALSEITEEVLTGTWQRVRQYRFEYYPLDLPNGKTVSQLAKISEFGKTDENAFPPIQLGYSPVADMTNAFSVASQMVPPVPFVDNNEPGCTYGARLVDVNGDGLADIVRSSENNGSHDIREYWENDGTAWRRISPHPLEPAVPFNRRDNKQDYGASFLDIDGDGFEDVVRSSARQSRSMNPVPVVFDMHDWQRNLQGLGFDTVRDYPLPEPSVIRRTGEGNYGWHCKWVDLTADGLVDLFSVYWRYSQASPGYVRHTRLWVNDGGTWREQVSPPESNYEFLRIYERYVTDYKPRLIDHNGDGLPDIFRSACNMEYDQDFPPTYFEINDYQQNVSQYGWQVSEDVNPFPFFNIWTGADYGAQFLDVNGDGALDLWITTRGFSFYTYFYINTHAGWQRPPSGLMPDYALPNSDRVYFTEYAEGWDYGYQIGDVNGDGLSDLVCSSDGPYGSLRKVYLNKNHAPFLLNRIKNGDGEEILVEYSSQVPSSMRLYDPKEGALCSSRVPYVVQTVSRVTRNVVSFDDAGTSHTDSYDTLYRYADGLHADREFRGFGKAKEIDGATGNFTITEFYQDYCRKGQVRCVRTYVGDRRDYRADGTVSGALKGPAEESIPSYEPKLVSEAYNNFRIVIHAKDANPLKTYTDTNRSVGVPDNDFPEGITLVTPSCTVTRTYEYGGNYSRATSDAAQITTAQEYFFDTRGNLTQSIDYGQVRTLSSDLYEPRIDVTFVNESPDGGPEDGRIAAMVAYECRRDGTWVDVAVCSNTSGFYTADRLSGARSQDIRTLQAQTIEYDASNRPVRVTQTLDTGPDPITEYQYDQYGNIIRSVDPKGGVTSITFDQDFQQFPHTVTNALGHSETYQYDPGFGVLVSHTDANGRTRHASYDGWGRPIEMTDSSGNVLSSYEYEFLNDDFLGYTPEKMTVIMHTPTGQVRQVQCFDGMGRINQALVTGQRGDSDPVRTCVAYNDRGLVWKRSRPHWSTEAPHAHWECMFLENDDVMKPPGLKTWARMGLNRPVRSEAEMNPSQTAVTRTVFETPLSVKAIDALNRERRILQDAFGNCSGVWEPDNTGSVGGYANPVGQWTAFGHDALGRLEFVRRHLSGRLFQDADPVTNIYYDSLGRKTFLDDPDIGLNTFEYDLHGNLVRSTDARGLETIREYDVLDRVTRTSYPDTIGAVASHTYLYDTGGGSNLVGRLARAQSPTCTLSYSYDSEGRAERVERTIDAVTYVTATTYDYAARPIRMVYPDGMQLLYEYDPATQNLDSIRSNSGQYILQDVQTNSFGAIASLTLGNGVSRTNAFDFAGRVHGLQTQKGFEALSNLNLTFDANSNVLEIQESAGPSPYGHMYYVYDVFNRLLKAYGTTMSGASAGTVANPAYAYSYDVLGRMITNNRFKNASYAGYTLQYTYSQDPNADRPAHAPRGIRFVKEGYPTVYAHEFRYDSAGNQNRSSNGQAAVLPKNDLSRQFVWDALGRLESVIAQGHTTHFAYDHENNRVKKTTSSGSVVYVGDIAEVTTGGMTKHIFAGNQRVATIRPDATTLFYAADQLGSSTLITNDAGAVVQRMDYEPYGSLIENQRSGNGLGLRHTYTGQETDADIGLMYYRARYYDPVVGTFTSADSITPNPNNPQAHNRYAYVLNNPILYSDPTGHNWWSDFTRDVRNGAEDAYSDVRGGVEHIGDEIGHHWNRTRQNWAHGWVDNRATIIHYAGYAGATVASCFGQVWLSAAILTATEGLSRGIEHHESGKQFHQGFLQGLGIGAATSLAGAYAGDIFAGEGFAAGFGNAFAGGFATGATGTALNGGSFEESLRQGLIQGAISGGLFAGAYGIQQMCSPEDPSSPYVGEVTGNPDNMIAANSNGSEMSDAGFPIYVSGTGQCDRIYRDGNYIWNTRCYPAASKGDAKGMWNGCLPAFHKWYEAGKCVVGGLSKSEQRSK